MFLIVGLGNPGAQYARTRHNAGWFVIDELARRHSIEVARKTHESLIGSAALIGVSLTNRVLEAPRFTLVKPQTFMNLSGRAVASLMRYHRIEHAHLIVVCDDLNLPLGKLRLRAGGSDGGHNGLKSVAQHLASNEYARLRFGVGEPPGDERRERGTAGHVLSAFAPDEWPLVEAATQRAADCIETFMRDGVPTAMNRFNG